LYNKDNRIFDTVDDFGNYPIHTAAIHAPVCNTQYLLSINKENLERKNDKGLTPLLCAVIAGNLESVDLLLKMGANVNHKLPNCLNALFLALERGDE
jgi:ankyrin repeat protein